MARTYVGEPVERPTPVIDDGLGQLAPLRGDRPATGAENIPIPSLPDHRAPFGALVGTFVQDTRLGVEVKQSGAGRALINPGLHLPVQSLTEQPDGRRIARPMPTAARDENEVIR